VLRDELLEPTGFGAPLSVWRCNDWPLVPNDGSFPTSMTFPSDRGIWLVKWALEAGATATSGNEMVEMEDASPGFRATQTVDVTLVMRGSVTIEFHDGETRTVGQGGVIVVNGNRHAWHNHSPELCELASVIVGARLAQEGS
jgi:hypothetical protein